MKKLFIQLKKIKSEINSKRKELKEIDDLHYYQTIGKNEKERDRNLIKIELKSLLSQEYNLLENIQRKAEICKTINSEKSRNIIIYEKLV